MNNNSRITSILRASNLDFSITGLQTFDLSDLQLGSDFEFQLPTNLRLGHLAEKIVSQLIQSSSNYNLLFENIQLSENNQTVGEIDFIVSSEDKKTITHIELAYKFYLYDPTLSSEQINNWIGPNRNDSLKEKLKKIKHKQLPLLYHNAAKLKFNQIDVHQVSQKVCFLASLFIPYQDNTSFSSSYEQAIKGYYLNLEKFKTMDHSDSGYYLPHKQEWGMDPSDNQNWAAFGTIKDHIEKGVEEKQSLLCWQKHNGSFLEFFIVWW